MSRMNSQSRSLRIISRQNGWDPYQIEGFGSIAPLDHCRETPFEGDTSPIPGTMSGAQDQGRTALNGEPQAIPADERSKPSRTSNADPAPGMPGA